MSSDGNGKGTVGRKEDPTSESSRDLEKRRSSAMGYRVRSGSTIRRGSFQSSNFEILVRN